MLEDAYRLGDVHLAAVSECHDEASREFCGERSSQTVDGIVVGRGADGVFVHSAFLIHVYSVVSLEARTVLCLLRGVCHYLHFENGSVGIVCL